MADLDDLSDAELRAKLIEHGFGNLPITSTTRGLYIKKLKAKLATATSTTPSVGEAKETKSRRRSAPVKASAGARRSITVPPVHQTVDDEEETQVTDGESVRETARKASLATSKSRRAPDVSALGIRNGNAEAESDNIPHAMKTMTDEELIIGLVENNITFTAVDAKTRPILMKKLNHVLARKRQQQKTEATAVKSRSKQLSVACGPDKSIVFDKTQNDSDEDNFMDIDNNSSQASPSEKHKVSLTFSPQHSLTLGNDSTDRGSQASTWKSLFSSPKLPSLRKQKVLNRFVEEQEEPYDTGSDSDVGRNVSRHKEPSRSWNPVSWLRVPSLWKRRVTVNLEQSESKFSILNYFKEQANSVMQWQMITVVLPILAVLFFICIGALYMSSTGWGPVEKQTDVYPLCQGERPTEPCITSEEVLDQLKPLVAPLREKLRDQAVSHQCHGESTDSVSSVELQRWKPLSPEVLEAFRNASAVNRHWKVETAGDKWTLVSAHLPLWCSVKQKLVTFFIIVFITLIGFCLVYVGKKLALYYWRQQQAQEHEVFALVEASIDLLSRHHASVMAEKRTDEAFLAVNHVRDVLIAPKDRRRKQKIWQQAVKFLEENESRVRAEVQQIKGEEYRVWRWLPPVTTPSRFDEAPPTASADTVRARVWQGQAFSTGKDGVNAPPPHPLTPCLKVRNMFDAEVECGDYWPVRVKDAILEKAEGTPIYHIEVDKTSREGCVYIMCETAEEAGKVYKALHGWWFDGSLVTVKYLRKERYLQRFPEAARATVPLKPSNEDRLSLPQRYWRSPLEHF